MNAVTDSDATALVVVDWGSSSLRGARLGARGQVLEQRAFSRGILYVPDGDFRAVFDASFGDWNRANDAPCLISGMAGSKQGWQEAPYCACPAGFDDLAAKLLWLAGVPDRAAIAIVPGLCCEHDTMVAGLTTVPDVMRGEEVQIFGAMALRSITDGVFVLPGTHSKWARVRAGRVIDFRTYMSGEFFALLSQHAILAKSIALDAEPDAAAFALGVRRAAEGAGLLHNAFGTRALALFNRMQPAALTSYLSGLVIGEELQAQQLDPATEVVLIGAAALTERYAQALALFGVGSRALGAQATWAGLFALSSALPRKDHR